MYIICFWRKGKLFTVPVFDVLNITCSSCFTPLGGRAHIACSRRLLGTECHGCGRALHRGPSRKTLPGPRDVSHHCGRGPQASNQGRGPAGLRPSLTCCICLPPQSATGSRSPLFLQSAVLRLFFFFFFSGSSERWPNFKQFFTHTKK